MKRLRPAVPSPLVIAGVNLAVSGRTVATTAAAIDTALAGTSVAVTHLVINLGANDVDAVLNETTWKTNYNYILNALHTKWPTAPIYISKPWTRGQDADCDTLAGWIDDLIAEEPTWRFAGADERGASSLESTDDGATYYLDGRHFSDAGHNLYSSLMLTAMGY